MLWVSWVGWNVFDLLPSIWYILLCELIWPNTDNQGIIIPGRKGNLVWTELTEGAPQTAVFYSFCGKISDPGCRFT
jgi:hypothetical protein